MAYPNTPAPNSIEEVGTDFRVTTKRALDGTPHKRYHGGGELRKWKLEYNYLDSAGQATLDAYYRTNKADYITDTWSHPTDTSAQDVNVSIASFRRGKFTGSTRSYVVELQEEP